MNEELREMTSRWLDRGESYEDVLAALKAEVESIQDLIADGKYGRGCD